MEKEKPVRLGQKVRIQDKGVGTVAFVGMTTFAAGKWIGIVLDEPNGKNNGNVQGKTYFKCNDNYGLFVRPAQIIPIDDASADSVPDENTIDLPTGLSNMVRSPSNQSLGSKSQGSTNSGISTPVQNKTALSSEPTFKKPSALKVPSSSKLPGPPKANPRGENDLETEEGLVKTPYSSDDIAKKGVNPPNKAYSTENVNITTSSNANSDNASTTSLSSAESSQLLSSANDQSHQDASNTVISKPQTTDTRATVRKQSIPTIPKPGTTQSTAAVENDQSQNGANDQEVITALKTKLIDYEEQIQTLIKKRREDVEKTKDFERAKIQVDQLQTYKREAQERLNELNHKLQAQENELKDVKEKFLTYKDEMSDVEERIESVTLDKEFAEEKLESVVLENTTLKEKLEEVTLELDVIKGEIQLNGPSQAADTIQKKVDDERTVKMEQALVKLRDLLLAKQSDADALTKQSEEMVQKLKVLTKENEHYKTDVASMQTTITDLKEQVDTCLGAQQMVDILTTKNLSLEDQVRELQETESLCDMDKEIEQNAKEVERDLRESVDLKQTQLQESERQIELLRYSIGDHEKTILKFRETVKNMQAQNDQLKKQMEKYDEQLKLATSTQSSDFTSKILETKSYAKTIESELKKLDAANSKRHVTLLLMFLPEQFIKRGGDHDCILVQLLIQRLIAKCDLLATRIKEKFERIDKVTEEDVIKSHRAEQWSFACELCQILSTFQLILRKYAKAVETCSPEILRQLGAAYLELCMHEKSIDFLIDLLQKDQLHGAISLDAIDKAIGFYRHIYKSNLSQEKFSMSDYMNGVTRVVSIASDSLQTDIQRLQVLMKNGNNESQFASLVKRLVTSNEQIKTQANRIHRLIPQESDTQRWILLDTPTILAIETIIKNLERLCKTFREICNGLTSQIIMLADSNEHVSIQEIENIAYQACDKVYKSEDGGPYESLWSSMHEAVTVLSTISNGLETGAFDSTQQEEKSRSPINILADQLKATMNESDVIRSKLEIKDEELMELRKLLKLKTDELGEVNIRLSLNDKKIDTVQRESEDKLNKIKQQLEETKVDLQKKIKQCEETIEVLQNDNEQLEQEKTALKDRLNKLSKKTLVDDIITKKGQRTSLLSPTGAFQPVDGKSSPQRQISSPYFETNPSYIEREISVLRNTIKILKDELWHLKTNKNMQEFSKLTPLSSSSTGNENEGKENEMADIYKNSTTLLNDLYSTIVNYKITGENVAAKQELLRSKMKLVEQTASDLGNRLNKCQSKLLPGSTIQTSMKTFTNPEFAKSLNKDRQLVAEIHLPCNNGGKKDEIELNITQDQWRLIMHEIAGHV
ncbi:unnamed protein product [Didymodactylos carnosus]|uniref:Dynactin subunit 1 n=1 Tax=Didymodactylos carnosus TaxID=1234261 RepID=A0A814P7N9_9BILA|nr:unnamed protein product [Didymodactylos carnosus]CAF1103779.1 unnamed protein product [Didymodactylos carnosus]CAF3649537.1 unnamed protein product [Didymodactylos carnosus]CAF3868555.1 unnamed protein product [Didymodactylos carnosus]